MVSRSITGRLGWIRITGCERRLGNFLGQDVECRVQWQWGTYTLFDMGYDHYFKGSYVDNLARIPGNPSAKDSDYFYFQTELRF